MLNLLRRIFRKIYTFVRKDRINIFETIFINFYFLPFKQALRLPILVYGKLRMNSIQGDIYLDVDKISKGIVKINARNDSSSGSGGETEISLNHGTIIFKGRAQIGRGCKILVYNNGVVQFGSYFHCMNMNNIGCCNKIIIGDYVTIGHQNQIFDTDFHFIVNDKFVSKPNSCPVIIGDNVWLTNRTSIMKGVHLSPYTIVGSNSLVNKTYAEEGVFLCGTPARPLGGKVYFVKNWRVENWLYQYFKDHPDATDVVLPENMRNLTFIPKQR